MYKATLEITDITVDLSGTYTINSKNSSGESNAKISLNFDNDQKSAEPIDGCRPQFLEKPLIKQSDDLKHVQFDCRLIADPKPEIQWLHNGIPLDISNSKTESLLIPVQSSTSTSALTASAKNHPAYLATLILKGVEVDRTGEYKCVATNKHASN